MAGRRKPGPQCFYNDPIDIEDGTTCLAQSFPPGPIDSTSALLSYERRPKSVSRMTHQEKMEEAIRRAHERAQISDQVFKQLPSVKQLVIGIVVVGGVLASLGIATGAVASTGVGAVLEGIAAGIVLTLSAIGMITSLDQVVAGIKTLMKFYEATRKAQTPEDLDSVGKDFAAGLAEVGVGTVMMILSVLGARQGLKMGKGSLGKWNAGKTVPEEPVPPETEPREEDLSEKRAKMEKAKAERSIKLRQQKLKEAVAGSRG